MNESDQKLATLTLKIQLPEPNNLIDIVQKGIDNQELATCAVYELLEQLYSLDSHCVMILVDQYNWLYK